MSYGIRLLFEDQRSIDSGDIDVGYDLVGTVFDNPVRILMLDNLTNGDLQISIDGIHDHFIMAAGSGKIIDVCSNVASSGGDGSGAFLIARGDGIYVKYITVPSSGSLYVSVMYGKGD